jgi:hypothetical protein
MEPQEQTNVKQWIAKWCIVIAFAGLVFYIVYPKYFVKFCGAGPAFRINQITGTTEVYVEIKGIGYRWKEISSYDNDYYNNDKQESKHG